jgi:hypothetical protein
MMKKTILRTTIILLILLGVLFTHCSNERIGDTNFCEITTGSETFSLHLSATCKRNEPPHIDCGFIYSSDAASSRSHGADSEDSVKRRRANIPELRLSVLKYTLLIQTISSSFK